jgi:hypothetical protein
MPRPRLTKELARSAADLRRGPGFTAAVSDSLTRMVRDGLPAALEAHLAEVAV